MKVVGHARRHQPGAGRLAELTHARQVPDFRVAAGRRAGLEKEHAVVLVKCNADYGSKGSTLVTLKLINPAPVAFRVAHVGGEASKKNK